jgi:hypothetical protein
MAASGQIERRPAGRTVFGHPIGLTNHRPTLWQEISFSQHTPGKTDFRCASEGVDPRPVLADSAKKDTAF